MLNSCVLPTLAYGSQTWATTKEEKNKIRTTYNAMLRSMLGKKLKDKIRTTELQARVKKSKDFVREIRERKWNWMEHVERMQDDRWTQRIYKMVA